jgi:hypothetical protein
VLPLRFFTQAVCQQQAGCAGTLQRARLAFKRWWVLLLLRLGGVQVDCLWTEARYEKALLVAGFTQIEVSNMERAVSASAPSRLIRVLFLVCLHRAAGVPPSSSPFVLVFALIVQAGVSWSGPLCCCVEPWRHRCNSHAAAAFAVCRGRVGLALSSHTQTFD